MVFIGSLIKLRPFSEGDYKSTIVWREDPELRKLALFHSFPVTESLEKEWLESILHSKSDKDFCFAIEEIKGNNLIGYFQLKKINWISRNAWLGISIGDKDSRGKGYGKEAMKLGLHYAFDMLNLRKISLEVLADNKPAISLYMKIGFEEEGVFKQHFFFDGVYFDVKVMGFFK